MVDSALSALSRHNAHANITSMPEGYAPIFDGDNLRRPLPVIWREKPYVIAVRFQLAKWISRWPSKGTELG